MEQCNNEDHEVGSLSDESAIKTKDQIEPLADVESKSDVGCHNAAPGNQPYTAAKTCRINGADVVKEINSSTSSPSEVGAFLVSSAAACSTKEQLSAKVQLVEEPKAPSLETLMAVDEPILNSKKLISNCQDSTADISTGNPERIVSREVGSFSVSGTVTSKEYLASNTPELATSLSPQVSEELRSVSTLRQQTSLGKKEFSSTFNEANLRKPSAFVVPPSDPFGNVDSSSSPADDKPLSLGMRVVSSTLNQENLQTTSVFDAPPLYTCGSADSSTSLGKREFSSTFNQANLRTPSAFVVPPSDPFGSAIASFSSVDDHVVELQEVNNADLGNEPIGNCSDSCNNIQGEPVHAFLAENYGEFPLAVGSPSSFEFPQETSLALFPFYRRKIIRCSEGNSVLKYSSHETNKQKSVVVCDGACVFRQRLCLGLFITLTVVGVILSLAIPLSRRADSQHYYNDLKAIIIDNSISSSSSINTKGSPQNDALNWLAFEDAANIPVSLQSWVIQRYITAVLYYSLNGQSWENQYNFLSGDHECRWNGYWNEIYLSAEGITCDSYGNAIFVVLGTECECGECPAPFFALAFLYLICFFLFFPPLWFCSPKWP